MNTNTFTGGCTSPKVAQNKSETLGPCIYANSICKKKKKMMIIKLLINRQNENLLNRHTDFNLTHKTWLWVRQVPSRRMGKKTHKIDGFFFT